MLEIRSESPASGVSMKAQSTDCSRARFWICSVCLENGNAYPGTLRKGPAETCMGMTPRRQSPLRCLVDPFESAKLRMAPQAPQLASVCDSSLPKKETCPTLAGREVPALRGVYRYGRKTNKIYRTGCT